MEGVRFFESPDPKRYPELGISREDLIWMWRTMLRIRRFEERAAKIYLEEKKLKGPMHLYIGQEAVATGVMRALDREDYVVSTYRGHGHAIARGVPMGAVMSEIYGKATGTCRGLGGSMHASLYPEAGILVTTAIVGSGIPIAAGIGYALKYRGLKSVVAVFFGDGAINTGAFHEGVNVIALWKLPVVLVCENNLYGQGTRITRSTAGVRGDSMIHRALGYGIEGLSFDGNDPVAAFLAAKHAVEKARRDGGPTLLEARTYRLLGHGIYDQGTKYRSREEIEEWRKREPIARFRRILVDNGYSSEEELRGIEAEVIAEVEHAVKFAEESPYLDYSELFRLVYA